MVKKDLVIVWQYQNNLYLCISQLKTTTMTTEQLIQQKIEIILNNVEEKLIETSTMVSTLGNHKISHKGVKLSLTDLFNFRKMDMKGFITYLYLSNQNKEVFGDLSMEDTIHILTNVVSEKITNQLVKIHLNK